MRKRRSSGRVTLQDVADYVGVGTMTVSRALREPLLVSEKVRTKIQKAASILGYTSPTVSTPPASNERVTLEEVAQHAGVGQMTVSRALRDPSLVAEETLQRINKAVAVLGYTPPLSQIAHISACNTVAVVCPFPDEKYSGIFMQDLINLLGKQHYQVLLSFHEYNQFTEYRAIEKLLQCRPVALILFGAQLSTKTQHIIRNSDVFTVNIGSYEQIYPALNIKFDMSLASEDMTQYLIGKGYKNIAFIGAHTDNRLQKQQINGWNKVMLAHYLNTDARITVPDAPDLKLGRYAITELLQTFPDLDAVICSHEEIAFGVIHECHQRMKKIPYDLAVVALESSVDSEQCFPSITAMQLNYSKLAIQVENYLNMQMENTTVSMTDRIITHSLHIRDSA